MRSSTSFSRTRLPRIALGLLLVGCLAWAAGAIYCVKFDPQARFYRAAIERKRIWAERLEREYPAKTVVCGGSSTAFGFDGERLERVHHLPTVNFGLHAGFGMRFLTQVALRACRPGDTLVLAMEPSAFTEPLTAEAGAFHVAYALGEPSLLADQSDAPVGLSGLSSLFSLRPGAYQILVGIGKLLRGQPAYRYRLEELSPSGWQTTSVRTEIGSPGHSGSLTREAADFLNVLTRECHRHHLRLIICLPWGYGAPEQATTHRLENLRLVRQLIALAPVLRDPALGVHSQRSHFADTGWHLTEDAAALRTDAFAAQMHEGTFWSPESLAEAERSLVNGSQSMPPH